jgi:galactitol-specific phosphotransferase system IIB component
MKASYLIELVEEFCKENNLDISLVYKKMAQVYQDTYGVNIIIAMQETGEWDITKYLESRDIIDRYVHILNGLKKMIKNDWDLELDKL